MVDAVYDSFPEAAPDYARDAQMEALRVPPHSIQAEQAVLGGLMLDNGAWDKVADQVGEQDFYRLEHQLVYAAIASLAEANRPFDVVTLAEELGRLESLDEVGGLPYLGMLANETPSASNIQAYAAIVREQSVVRQLIRVGSQIAEAGFRPKGRKVHELLDHAENLVFQIAEQQARGGGGFRPITRLLTETINRIEELYGSDDALTGVPTGFTDFDAKTSGLQKSDLIIVAGRPSMGKTTFAMNIAENVAVATGLPVAVFSMEMPGEALTMRMISSLGRVNQQAVRSGKLEDDDWPRVTSAVNILNNTKLFIDDTPALTPTELRARCRRLTKENGQLGLVVIDYLQLMQAPESGENRATEISAISRALKALAKELNVPVIALSQLNRSLEQRPNKRPVMSDLRESGAIEQDADVIVFIYRDE
ncbi:MAG: replicative DNA helicase, partial [Gammaproteobacteria bacterium]|nr:replicative DNA helicase [Gammaproteobacteria bacterium]